MSAIKIAISLTSSPSTPRIQVNVPRGTTAKSLYQLVSDSTSIPLEQVKIIYRGRLIPKTSEDNVIDGFSLEESCVIHCMGKPSQTSTPDATGGSATAAGNASGSITNPSAATLNSLGATASVVHPPPTSSTAATATASPVGNASHPLKAALETMKANHDASTYGTGVSTLFKILDNIMSHPMEEKYRKVKKGNAAFHKRLGRLAGATDAILSIGFKVEKDGENEVFLLTPSADAWPKLVECKVILDLANKEAQRNVNVGGINANSQNTGSTMPGLTPGMNAPMGGGGGMGMPSSQGFSSMMGDMGGGGLNPEQAMSSMLQNPEQLRAMLDNPMVQRMMESDPRIANNPMARQSLEMIRRNPQMLQEASRMMSSNPELMRNMMNNNSSGGTGAPAGGMDMEAMRRSMEMMQAMNGGGGITGMAPQQPQQQTQQNEGNGSNAGNNNQNSGNNGSGGDSEMTEEEMIAEAIARSLRES